MGAAGVFSFIARGVSGAFASQKLLVPLDGKHHCHECHGTSYVSAIDDVGVLMAKAGGIWTVDATNPPLIRVIWWGKVGESVDMKEAAAAAFLAAQS